MCVFLHSVLLSVVRRNLQIVTQINVYREEHRLFELLVFIFYALNSEFFLTCLGLSVLSGAAVFRTTLLRYNVYWHVFL